MQAHNLFDVEPSSEILSGWTGIAIVYGAPQTMGSKRGFQTKSGRIAIVDDQNKKLRSFQREVKAAMRECRPRDPLSGPIELVLEIVTQRPKSHYGTGRNEGVLKPGAPSLVTTKPDIDKVQRAIYDCGTGIWFKDDAQVARVMAVKRYARRGEEQHVRVEGSELLEECN